MLVNLDYISHESAIVVVVYTQTFAPELNVYRMQAFSSFVRGLMGNCIKVPVRPTVVEGSLCEIGCGKEKQGKKQD